MALTEPFGSAEPRLKNTEVTRLPKVIWEESRVAALSDTGGTVASMRIAETQSAMQCGVAFIHEYG